MSDTEDKSLKAEELKAEIEKAIGAAPPMMVAGKRNPEHLRWQMALYSFQHIRSLYGQGDMGKGNTPASMVDWVSTEAAMNGIDPKKLKDTRSDAVIIEDAVARLVENEESAGELTDTEYDLLLRAIKIEMDKSDRECEELAEAPNSDAAIRRDIKKPVKIRKLILKKWMARIEMVRALRDRAKHAVPPGTKPGLKRAREMAHPLRYMLWVGRPGGGSRKHFIIGKHHCIMAQYLYFGRTGEVLDPSTGKWCPCKKPGVFYILPPGHGKSAFAGHAISLMLSQNPRLRCVFVHAQEDMAQLNLQMVAGNFDPEQASGRRNRSMFDLPEIEESSSKKFRFRLPERQKSPTIVAAGMTAAKSGADVDIFWPDDPCDQKLAEQPAERVRVFDRLNGTWRRRKRGSKGHFEFYTSTMWHHDDPTARTLAQIRAGQAKYHLCRMPCGGPKDNFKALWPEEYPSQYLKDTYTEMRNPRLYATVFECNPQPEELRKIKRLAYYDPTTEEHKRFLESAVNHVSLDPTAKKDEKCDKASFVYCGMGDIVTEVGGVYSYDKRLRVLDARQFHASQAEGVDEVIAWAEFHSTHYIHVETRSGFDASREFFEREGFDVIGHDPKNRKKGLRLADVAAMLDDSLRDKGFPGAVVEFPGKPDENGRVVADPEGQVKWVEDQILDFGVAVEDHAVDALTQLCQHLGPELRVNVGTVTEQIQKQRRESNDPRIKQYMDRIFNRNQPGGGADAEDARFFQE